MKKIISQTDNDNNMYFSDNNESVDVSRYSPAQSQDSTEKEYNMAKQNMDNIHPLKIIIDVALWSLVVLPIGILHFCVQPYHRGFYCNDESIRYPNLPNTVSTAALIGFGLAIPTVTIFIVEAYRTFFFEPVVLGRKVDIRYIGKSVSCHPYFIRLYYYLGYFLFGAAICQLFTDIGKYTIGRLTPHFITICNPTMTCKDLSYIMDECPVGADMIKDSRLSFPSGHSSFSFYAATFTVLYLQGQVVWPMISQLVKSTIQCIFMALALFTALSRISDYKHHWSDVFAGSALGIIVATVVCLSFVGLFRYPKQQIIVNGIIAPNVKSLQQIRNEELYKCTLTLVYTNVNCLGK